MIQIRHDNLRFSFPEIHEDAVLDIEFERTLRIPDDDKAHSLPPGLGHFPLRNIDRYQGTAPADWLENGGVMLPMFQSEALWLNFTAHAYYPFLVMIAAGGINAVTGDPHDGKVVRNPQNYIVSPEQPWLDGFCIEKGVIRQFVAAPLGKGYTAEEQITGQAEHGGLQFAVYPMKSAEWEKFNNRDALSRHGNMCMCEISMCDPIGLAPGGKMHQEIYEDPHRFAVWDLNSPSRCFVRIANSLTWRAITGEAPPTIPPTAEQYTAAGLPWFDYFDAEQEALAGSTKLAGLKSVATLDQGKHDPLLPENRPVGPVRPVILKGDRIREWAQGEV